jgi:hypothetical protein
VCSVLQVLDVTDFRCPGDKKNKGFKSGEGAGHAVGPRRRIHCFGNTLKNYRAAKKENVVEHRNA